MRALKLQFFDATNGGYSSWLRSPSLGCLVCFCGQKLRMFFFSRLTVLSWAPDHASQGGREECLTRTQWGVISTLEIMGYCHHSQLNTDQRLFIIDPSHALAGSISPFHVPPSSAQIVSSHHLTQTLGFLRKQSSRPCDE